MKNIVLSISVFLCIVLASCNKEATEKNNIAQGNLATQTKNWLNSKKTSTSIEKNKKLDNLIQNLETDQPIKAKVM